MEASILKGIEENCVEELSSELLYRGLAAIDRKPERKALLEQLARYETSHASLWGQLLEKNGCPKPSPRLILKHRMFLWVARTFGVASVLSSVHKDEVDGIKKYHAQHADWKSPEIAEVFQQILPDELSHEIDTSRAARNAVRDGGVLRSAILGSNDGVVSILALSAGVVGATFSDKAAIIAGTAGLVAGAVSMAASNYVSVKAEEEMYRGLEALEADAAKVDRGAKVDQLREIYRGKGFSEAESRAIVERLSSNDAEFTRALLAERHGIGEASFSSPLRLGTYTGVAFGLAGLVPLLPFFFLPPLPALLVSVVASAFVLFGTGVFRSLSTLTSMSRSGFEMLGIGLGSAALTYVIGLLVAILIH
ncbi:MAG: VIT1/CCC1 transporter family protein [Nitrososphaerota archaeon]|nr:VIT1/CCC1 transporter family protein [Nitrososphaerota archaeon]